MIRIRTDIGLVVGILRPTIVTLSQSRGAGAWPSLQNFDAPLAAADSGPGAAVIAKANIANRTGPRRAKETSPLQPKVRFFSQPRVSLSPTSRTGAGFRVRPTLMEPTEYRLKMSKPAVATPAHCDRYCRCSLSADCLTLQAVALE